MNIHASDLHRDYLKPVKPRKRTKIHAVALQRTFARAELWLFSSLNFTFFSVIVAFAVVFLQGPYFDSTSCNALSATDMLSVISIPGRVAQFNVTCSLSHNGMTISCETSNASLPLKGIYFINYIISCLSKVCKENQDCILGHWVNEGITGQNTLSRLS